MTAPSVASEDRTPADDSASVDADAVPRSVRRIACCRATGGDRSADEVAAVAPEDPTALARRIRRADRVTGAAVLATCNRVEAYVATRTPADLPAGIEATREALAVPDGVRTERGRDAVEHLVRVACGLDSRVLGEDHVLGQVRRAFESAADEGLAGGVLSRAADAAVAAGRAARAETAIDEGTVGYGGATCEAIAERIGAPDRLVAVGGGEMASAVVGAATARWDVRVDVVGRSSGTDLPTADGRFRPLSDLSDAVADADAVVTATGAPEPVFGRAAAAALDPSAPVVDLANPPDVAEAVRNSDRPVVRLDAIQSRVAEAVDGRRDAVPAVERRVAEAVARFCRRERESRAEDAIRELHRTASATREAELERARRRLASGDADPETVLEDATRALTSSLLATPTERLRESAREGDEATIAAARRLFGLDEDDA